MKLVGNVKNSGFSLDVRFNWKESSKMKDYMNY